MTDRTIYQLERAMDALILAIKYLKEDTQPYQYSISTEDNTFDYINYVGSRVPGAMGNDVINL